MAEIDLGKVVPDEVIKEIVSDAWNPLITYAVGQYCIHNNILWKCLVANTNIEPAEGTYWTQTTIDEEITSVNSSLSVFETNIGIITEYDSNMTKDIVNIRLPKGIYLVLACSHPSETIYDGFECTPSSNNTFFATQSFVKEGQIGTGYMIASWNCIVENYSDTEDEICNIRLWCSKACKISTNYKVIRLKTNT